MVEFNNNLIRMHRGDAVYIDTVIFTACDGVYQPKKNEHTYFIVENKNKHIIIKKEFIDGETKLLGMDTAYLRPTDYRYKCILVYSSGDIETYCEGDLHLI